MNFVVDWLLCTVAFAAFETPTTTALVLRAAAAGVLIAIAINAAL